MRQCDPPVSYLVGTPKGQLTKLEQSLLEKPWHTARPSVKVKLLERDGETYVFAQSEDRIAKERSMRRRRLRKYLKSLADLTQRKRPLKRDELHQALGAAKKEAGRDARHVQVTVTLHGKGKAQTAALTYHLDRQIVLTRYTQPEKDLQLLLDQLQLKLPDQAPPKIQAPVASSNRKNL